MAIIATVSTPKRQPLHRRPPPRPAPYGNNPGTRDDRPESDEHPSALLHSELSSGIHSTQIREHEETVQVSPSVVRKTTIYESHRTLGAGQSTGFLTSPIASSGGGGISRSSSSHVRPTPNDESADDQHIEENYEVTVSAYNESGSGLSPSSRATTTARTLAADET